MNLSSRIDLTGFRIPATLAREKTVPVTVTLLGADGRILEELWSREVGVGDYSIPWDGTDRYGRAFASGTYFYRIQADGHSEFGRFVLLR